MTKGNKQNFQRKRKGHDATKQEKQERSPSSSKREESYPMFWKLPLLTIFY